MKRFAIIVAGGTGSRMKTDVPKQFLILGGKPVLMHSIEKFADCNAEVIVVLNENLFDEWKSLCGKYNFKISHQLANGGATRSESVFNGLKKIAETNPDNQKEIVAIHDAARPLVSKQLIEKLFAAAVENGNAVPAIKVAESLRRITSEGNDTANRDEFVVIQTPQCFHFEKLFDAYQKSTDLNFTDDASLFESQGYKINLVEGEKNNFKITVAEDLKIAEALIKD
ncbi:MAG: 2-C-methyl-D-erythritol 4-phosphate cytidylyltransferase [Bacteroidia bacterium]